MLVCAGLLHFNCCVSCTTMSICSLYTMRASTFQFPHVDVHTHTKTLWYKTTSRSDTTNPPRGRASVVPHKAERNARRLYHPN